MDRKEDVRTLWRGVTFSQLLTVLFVALKLTKVITWSWWWVLLPLWFGYALFATLVLVFGAVYVAVILATSILKAIESKKCKD